MTVDDVDDDDEW